MDPESGRHPQGRVQRFKQSFIYEHLLSLKASTLKDQDLSTLEEYNLVGTPAEVIDKIERFSNVGVTYCASLAISGNTGDDVAEQIQRFAEDVMPHFSPATV